MCVLIETIAWIHWKRECIAWWHSKYWQRLFWSGIWGWCGLCSRQRLRLHCIQHSEGEPWGFCGKWLLVSPCALFCYAGLSNVFIFDYFVETAHLWRPAGIQRHPTWGNIYLLKMIIISVNQKYTAPSLTIQSTLSKRTLSKPDTSLNRTANLVHSLPNCTCISVTELSLKRTPL